MTCCRIGQYNLKLLVALATGMRPGCDAAIMIIAVMLYAVYTEGSEMF
jgi:hypothetical protein